MVLQEIDPLLSTMSGFSAIDPESRREVLQYMLKTGVLHSDSGMVGMGRSGEKAFGAKNFMDLFSVFTLTTDGQSVPWEVRDREVHQLTFAVRDEGPAFAYSRGRSWQTKYIDWPRKRPTLSRLITGADLSG